MSLVNDMLNDLDLRRDNSAEAKLDLDWMAGAQQSAPTEKNRRLLIIAVVAVLVLAVGFYGWSVIKQNRSAAFKQEAIISAALASQVDTAAATNIPLAMASDDSPQQISGETVSLTGNLARHVADVPVLLAATAESAASQQNSVTQPSPAAQRRLAEPGPAVFKTAASAISPTPPSRSRIKKPAALSLDQLDRQAVQQARQYLAAGNTAAAQQHLKPFVQQYPSAKASAPLLISLLLTSEQSSEAQQLLAPLRQAQPNNVALLALQARLQLLAGDAATATELLMTTQPDIYAYPDYYELLAQAARHSGQYRLSAQAYRGLLDVEAGRGDWWVGLGIAQDAQGQISQARAAYRQAIASGNTAPALVAYARGRLSEALSQGQGSNIGIKRE